MMEKFREELLRNLPSIDKLIMEEKFKQLLQLYPRELIVDVTRKKIEIVRKEILNFNKLFMVANIEQKVDKPTIFKVSL